MPVISGATAPTFELPELRVTGLAAPSRGSRETCVWRLTLAAGAPGAVHSVDREEVFVVLSGLARATVDGVAHDVGPGDALIVPAGASFSLANPGPEPLEAVAVLPVGARATLPGGAAFSPPWTL